MFIWIGDQGRLFADPDSDREAEEFTLNRKGSIAFDAFVTNCGEEVIGSSSIDFPEEEGAPKGWRFDEWRALAYEVRS